MCVNGTGIQLDKLDNTFTRLDEYSYGNKSSGNLLIQGNNQDILPRLVEIYEERVKCIYIDPPYNNGETYLHYSDKYDHQLWLSNLVKTIKELRKFLTKDGSLWISIDDKEMHYLKVEVDKIFGRDNFITTIIWQHRNTRENRASFSHNHEYILLYAKNKKNFEKTIKKLPLSEDIRKRYKNPDNDPRGPWQSITANVQSGHAVSNQYYELISPSGKKFLPPNGRCWMYSLEKMRSEIAQGRIYFGKDGTGVPRIKKYLSETVKGATPETIWYFSDVGTTKDAKKQFLKEFPNTPVFDTIKPESLIKRIIELSTDEGDVVLDSFLGTGTTAVVANKLKRRFIGIEIGDHIKTIAFERLKRNMSPNQTSLEDFETDGNGFLFYYLRCSNNCSNLPS